MRLDEVAVALRQADAARAIGVSPRTLHRWTKDKSLGVPCRRIGRVILYPIDELKRWAANQNEVVIDAR